MLTTLACQVAPIDSVSFLNLYMLTTLACRVAPVDSVSFLNLYMLTTLALQVYLNSLSLSGCPRWQCQLH